jgi:RloB-like protein
MPRRDRVRKVARRPPFRLRKPTILVVCEGSVSEPQYLKGHKRNCRNPRVDIEFSRERGTPKTLVEIAKRMKREAEIEADREGDQNLAYDAVWCVFDVDTHPHIADAQQMARHNGIRLAISNPCFELWLLLHFRDNPGMQDVNGVLSALSKFVHGYDKHIRYDSYVGGYREAVSRARQMAESAAKDGDPGRNPTTGVYELTELIRGED